MIQVAVKNYLKDRLKIPVYLEEPKTKPSEYVTVETIDAGRVNMIEAVTFNIVSISGTLQKAAELNEKVKAAMYDIIALDNISSSKCGGGGQAIDQGTKRYAYECVFNLFYMEE